MKFVVYTVANNYGPEHVRRAVMTDREREIMREHAPTFAAVSDVVCVKPEYDRVVTGTVDAWRHVARELYRFGEAVGPDDRSLSQRWALECAEQIADVIGDTCKYF